MRLWRHDNGYWYITYRRGVHKSLYTKDDAVAQAAFATKQKEYLEKKIHVIEERQFILLEKFKKEYLDTRTGQAASTYRMDELALDTFIEFYGNRPTAGITEPVTLKFRAHLKTILDLADNSANAYMRHLRGPIKYGLKQGYIPTIIDGRPNHPLDGLKQYHVDHSQKSWLEKDEILKLIAKAQEYPDMKTVVPVMVFTGTPRQNIVAPLHITATEIQYRRGKTKKLISVPIHDLLRPYIAHLAPGIHRLADMHPDTVSHKFKEIADAAGIPEGSSAHKLRHTFATQMLRAGVPIEKVSKWLGHADIRITLKFYADVLNDGDAEHINKFTL